MDRGLVVVQPTEEHRDLLREAAANASGSGADLLVLTNVTRAEYEADAEVLERIEAAEHTTFDDDVLDAAEKELREFARETLPEGGPPFEVVAVLADRDELADAVVDVADRRDCDHVYLRGRRRSPTGKALFGDVAQQVALNFDGFVTLTTRAATGS